MVLSAVVHSRHHSCLSAVCAYKAGRTCRGAAWEFTVCLTVSSNALSTGVATGAIFGHAIATAIAVIGGSIASQYISEKTVGYIGGVLFLVFAVATGFGYF